MMASRAQRSILGRGVWRSPVNRIIRHVLLAGALAVSAGAAFAQDAPGGEPRTGDARLDTWLGDINRYGERYPDAFVDELVRYHAAPRALVLELLRERSWPPGDVYYACALAIHIGRPCRAVVDEHERDRASGWAATALRLGLVGGSRSSALEAVKQGFVATYARWGRPPRPHSGRDGEVPADDAAPAGDHK